MIFLGQHDGIKQEVGDVEKQGPNKKTMVCLHSLIDLPLLPNSSTAAAPPT
jgi:hypothetical protein